MFSGVWDINYLDRLNNVAARYVLGGWQLSTIMQAQSGRVFSERLNVDVNNDGNINNERVPFAPRNGLRLPKFVTYDPRISKDVAVLPENRVRIRGSCSWR